MIKIHAEAVSLCSFFFERLRFVDLQIDSWILPSKEQMTENSSHQALSYYSNNNQPQPQSLPRPYASSSFSATSSSFPPSNPYYNPAPAMRTQTDHNSSRQPQPQQQQFPPQQLGPIPRRPNVYPEQQGRFPDVNPLPSYYPPMMPPNHFTPNTANVSNPNYGYYPANWNYRPT